MGKTIWAGVPRQDDSIRPEVHDRRARPGPARGSLAVSQGTRHTPTMPVPIHELFGIELPIIQAPMAGVQGSALAIAVSNAGGLGSLPCAMLSLDAMRSELAAITAGTAGRST